MSKLPNSKSILQDETEHRLRKELRDSKSRREQAEWNLGRAEMEMRVALKWELQDQRCLDEYLRERDQS